MPGQSLQKNVKTATGDWRTPAPRGRPSSQKKDGWVDRGGGGTPGEDTQEEGVGLLLSVGVFLDCPANGSFLLSKLGIGTQGPQAGIV